MEVLRQCPLTTAQRLVPHAIAVSTAVLGQSHKDNVRCTAHDLFWANLKVQLHLPALDLLIFWSRLEPCGMHTQGLNL